MTKFDQINNMNIDELAAFLADETKFPHSPCYVCRYDGMLACISPVICTKEYKTKVYKEWLAKEIEKSVESQDSGRGADAVECEHDWEYEDCYDFKNLEKVRKYRCRKCGAMDKATL